MPPVNRSALLAAISEADIVLNSSRTEGQCGAIMEAMALGTPVLARCNRGNCDLIGNGEDRGGLFKTAKECFKKVETGWYDKRMGWQQTPSPRVQARTSAALEFIKGNHNSEKEAIAYRELILKVTTRRENSD